MADSRRLVHTSRQSIRWADMDAFGHVNNVWYFRYMEQARIEWLRALPLPGGSMDGDEGPVIVNASCDFLLPLVYPAEIDVRMYVDRVGRSSIDTSYEVVKDGATYAAGASRLVWISRGTSRSTPLPAAIVAALRGEA